MVDLNLGLIGNGGLAALIDSRGTIVWSCMPRFDSDPVFCSLLAGSKAASGDGAYSIEVENRERSEQSYMGHSAVLVTRVTDAAGAEVEIVDFAPRMTLHARRFRPGMLVRMVRPLKGLPRIRVRCRPLGGYGSVTPERTRGSNHVRFVLPGLTLRLTTDAPIVHIEDEAYFALQEPQTFILGPDETLDRSVSEVGRDFLDGTLRYWHDWTRALAIPYEWQDAVLRAAVTLKLCSYEETGAVVAALTTSIPEAAGTARNWDYRFCWVRDAAFVIHTLNRLGKTSVLEGYVRWIVNIVASARDGKLQPLYSITHKADLIEAVAPALEGYRGMGPVRVGNQAYEQIQNDTYGAVVLACAHAFLDRRLSHIGTLQLYELLVPLARTAAEIWDKPDAGLWEYRGIARTHTYSAVLCWAAIDRMAIIASTLGREQEATHFRSRADEIRAEILERAWREDLGAFVASFGGDELDACLLLLNDLLFVTSDDPRYVATVRTIGKALRRGDHMFRYDRPDDFGMPENAFTVCTFWYVNALASIGEKAEARRLYEGLLATRNPLGMLSEDVDPTTGELWGNFPQTYSMVGLISSAIRLSKSWEQAY